MKRKRRHILSIELLVYLLLLILGPFLAAQAAESTTKEEAHYRVVETEDLRLLYYDEEHSYVVPYLAQCFENAFGCFAMASASELPSSTSSRT